MKLTDSNKDAIRDALVTFCNNLSSQNRAAEILQGVSSAVISQITNGKYSTISDAMFLKISTQIGFNFDNWMINTDSRNYQLATYAMADALMYKNVTWIVGAAGCGKTTAAREFQKTHRNVYYILCSEDMRRSDFVREIAKQVGSPVGNNLHDSLESALTMIQFLNNPLLIFDEGDKLSDSVLNYFISIYNHLEGRCGIILMSTDYIMKRIDNGRRLTKKGYEEIYSRIGRRFYSLDPTNKNDINSICRANGITQESEIKQVIMEAQKCDNDLRRVKKVVHARKRAAERKAKGE